MWSTWRGEFIDVVTGPNRCSRRYAGTGEWWYAQCPAPRREHVMGEVEFVILPAVVLPEENLDFVPRALDGICVCPGVRIDEVNAVVDGSMRVTLITDIVVGTPAITNDRSAGFDPVTYDDH